MSARTHLILFHLLSDSLYLHDEDYEAIRKEFSVYSYEHIKGRLIRSVPGRIMQKLAQVERRTRITGDQGLVPFFEGILMSQQFDWPFGIHHTARMFDYDLKGVPGFYYRNNDLESDQVDMLWRLNTPTAGILKPYYDNRGRIIGVFIYHNPKDELPRLLSSAGMCLGTPAAPVPPATSRSLL